VSLQLTTLTLVVPEYDSAIDYFTSALGFRLIEDTDLGGGKRWVVVSPSGDSGARLLLAKADSDHQRAAIGNQTGGRVFLFLESTDFDADYQAMLDRGVKFVETPRKEPYGHVVVFEDFVGNRWDLIQRTAI